MNQILCFKVLPQFTEHYLTIHKLILVCEMFISSLAGVVKDMMHSAFWNILSEELNDDPPRYDQALHLLEEIKEVSN